jgi:hypothetical protein
MFGDDTNILNSQKKYDEFVYVFNTVTSHIYEWFSANQLTLSVEKHM